MSAPIAVNQAEDLEEWEEHLILRVPADVVNRMERAVNNEPGAEELGVNICDETRVVQIRIGNQILPAKLLDLPTINEVHKTFDNATLFKVTDISQIIICDDALPPRKEEKNKQKQKGKGLENQTPNDSSGEGTSTEPGVNKPKTARQIAKEKAKEHHYPHGISAPMKNAKKRKFRKKKEKKIMAVEEIEKELKRLLRSDLEAQSVRWEIVEDDGSNPIPHEEEEIETFDPEDGSDDDKDDKDDLSDDEDTL
uniref:TAFII55_N domain-containing protein n=1 Tax=Caenorhabditis japonica TaxID=281687 RepID=A0A8R1I947_CAEJA